MCLIRKMLYYSSLDGMLKHTMELKRHHQKDQNYTNDLENGNIILAIS